LLIANGTSSAQNKQSKKEDQNIRTQSINSTKTDTNYDKSMAYFRFAEKNIIADKSKDESYKGKFYDQNNKEGSKSNLNSNSSNEKMMGSTNMMTRHKMGKKKMERDTTKTKAKKY
jgi:hypothetical protein